MSRESLGKTTVETSFFKLNTMRVICINGHEDLLIEGNIYNVSYVTEQGNFLLEEVDVPEPFTSFHSSRFAVLENVEKELEEEFWPGI